MYRGFFAHYYVHREMDRTNPVVTALLIQASLFARSYFSAVAAGERAKIGGMESWAGRGLAELTDAEKASFAAAVGELSTVVEELYDSVDFASGLCDDKTGKLSPDGDGIPMTVGNAGSLQGEDGCGVGATVYPGKDGLYNFSEAHNYVYLAYQQACGAQPAGECNNTNIELMWNRWQARKANPNHHYSDVPLLTTSGGYMLQLLYYTNNNFNNDTRYQELFYNNWWSDEMFYKQGLYAGKRGRYGLGEGPESKWCNERKSYMSFGLHEKIRAVTPGVREGMIIGMHTHCAAISANMVAGYLPANPDEIHKHLLLLLEDGETVEPIPCSDHAVLWRESLMDAKRGISSGDGREGELTLAPTPTPSPNPNPNPNPYRPNPNPNPNPYRPSPNPNPNPITLSPYPPHQGVSRPSTCRPPSWASPRSSCLIAIASTRSTRSTSRTTARSLGPPRRKSSGRGGCDA